MKRLAIPAAVAALFFSVVVAAPAQSVELPVGQVSNSATSSASVRAYDHRASESRLMVGNCDGNYVNVAPAKMTSAGWDADCIRMYSGSTKVTGLVYIKSRVTGSTTLVANVGCTTNRYDIAVHGTETGIVKYARKCS